ncbi:MAG: hypothetical protein H0X25_13550 [Acidobacteriales bacterium]|nr:hypothetical protein [Terriglobales bacterium]
MQLVQWWAQPWWVNLLMLVPVAAYWRWRRIGLRLRPSQLLFAAAFAIAFGFVEAAVVVYLRASIGLLPGFQGTLADIARHAPALESAQAATLPPSLLTIETCREAATIVMLVAVALLSAPRIRERWAMFLWCFAAWDLSYYAGLWATIHWPSSLLNLDVLFLIPEPWISQVWFPVAVSSLTMIAVAVSAVAKPAPVTQTAPGATLDFSTEPPSR